jgi:hypothetical protein
MARHHPGKELEGGQRLPSATDEHSQVATGDVEAQGLVVARELGLDAGADAHAPHHLLQQARGNVGLLLGGVLLFFAGLYLGWYNFLFLGFLDGRRLRSALGRRRSLGRDPYPRLTGPEPQEGSGAVGEDFHIHLITAKL